MPAQVIPFSRPSYPARTGPGGAAGAGRPAEWSLLEVALPGGRTAPYGVLLADSDSDRLHLRLSSSSDLEARLGAELDETSRDLLGLLEADLAAKAGEMGAAALLQTLEDSLSNFFRIGQRTAVVCRFGPGAETDRLYDLHVDAGGARFPTHLPVYELEAAASRFGGSFANAEGGGNGAADWIRTPSGLRVTPDMFVARVVGRSMEPRIPDGSLCVFRAGVAGSRQGRLLLVELFDETDYASRYTVKRYSSRKEAARPPDCAGGGPYDDDPGWRHASIRLEPLNREFEPFELDPDRFRVVAEFVAVLGD